MIKTGVKACIPTKNRWIYSSNQFFIISLSVMSSYVAGIELWLESTSMMLNMKCFTSRSTKHRRAGREIISQCMNFGFFIFGRSGKGSHLNSLPSPFSTLSPPEMVRLYLSKRFYNPRWYQSALLAIRHCVKSVLTFWSRNFTFKF